MFEPELLNLILNARKKGTTVTNNCKIGLGFLTIAIPKKHSLATIKHKKKGWGAGEEVKNKKITKERETY